MPTINGISRIMTREKGLTKSAAAGILRRVDLRKGIGLPQEKESPIMVTTSWSKIINMLHSNGQIRLAAEINWNLSDNNVPLDREIPVRFEGECPPSAMEILKRSELRQQADLAPLTETPSSHSLAAILYEGLKLGVRREHGLPLGSSIVDQMFKRTWLRLLLGLPPAIEYRTAQELVGYNRWQTHSITLLEINTADLLEAADTAEASQASSRLPANLARSKVRIRFRDHKWLTARSQPNAFFIKQEIARMVLNNALLREQLDLPPLPGEDKTVSLQEILNQSRGNDAKLLKQLFESGLYNDPSKIISILKQTATIPAQGRLLGVYLTLLFFAQKRADFGAAAAEALRVLQEAFPNDPVIWGKITDAASGFLFQYRHNKLWPFKISDKNEEGLTARLITAMAIRIERQEDRTVFVWYARRQGL